MTEKMLARVAVSSVPYAADRLYTYLVPDELIGSAEAGKRVTIPFGRGNRRVEGFLLEVGREAATSPLKPIDALLDDAPLLDAKDIRLVRWMKARYFCTYYDAIKTILPGGVWLQYRELWHVNGEISAEDALSSVAPDSLEETLLRAMLSAKEIERAALDELGSEKTAKALRSLEACGLAVRETKLRQRLQDKSVRMVSLCVSAEDALAAVEPKRRSAPVRYAVVELLSREGCLSSSEISYYTGATMQTLRGLKKAGLVEFSEREVLRVIAAARAMCDALRYACSQPPLKDLEVEVLGPAGAPVVKVNNRYRYCVYLCGKGGSVLRRTVSEYLLAFYARKENRGLDIFADCNALQ